MDRDAVGNMMRSAYEARARGDLVGLMAIFHEQGVFAVNGGGTGVDSLMKPAVGRQAIASVIGDLMRTWRFDNWRERSLTVDGERAVLHWSADVTCLPTGRSAQLDVVDILALKDGKVAEFRQFIDTAHVMAMAAGPGA
jgi:ketosteroid isomerase-like protein